MSDRASLKINDSYLNAKELLLSLCIQYNEIWRVAPELMPLFWTHLTHVILMVEKIQWPKETHIWREPNGPVVVGIQTQ